jgi:hypothetical protein
MKKLISSIILIVFTSLSFSCDKNNVQPKCIEGVVIGLACPYSTGFAGHAIRISQKELNAAEYTNPLTQEKYAYVLSAINLDSSYAKPGKKIFFTAREATSQELAALGPITANCGIPPAITLINISATKCPVNE